MPKAYVRKTEPEASDPDRDRHAFDEWTAKRERPPERLDDVTPEDVEPS